MNDIVLEAWLYCKYCLEWNWFFKYGHGWFCRDCGNKK